MLMVKGLTKTALGPFSATTSSVVPRAREAVVEHQECFQFSELLPLAPGKQVPFSVEIPAGTVVS